MLLINANFEIMLYGCEEEFIVFSGCSSGTETVFIRHLNSLAQ
jgi:hypothetical protein